MITDSGDITDQQFNQTTYEACRDYSKAHNIDFTYKKPDGDTDYARAAMVDMAVAGGCNVIVMPGYIFAQTVIDKRPGWNYRAVSYHCKANALSVCRTDQR